METDRCFIQDRCPSAKECSGNVPDVTVAADELEMAKTPVPQCSANEAKSLQTASCSQVRVLTSSFSPESVKAARVFAERAVKMHKIFSIQGPYPIIRAGLRARGWVEQRGSSSKQKAHHRHHEKMAVNIKDAGDSDSEDVEQNSSDDADVPDTVKQHRLMSRMVRHEMVYFFWTIRCNAINPHILHKDQIFNHFLNASSFTTKVGLCMNLRNLPWFDSANPDTFFPRCYMLGAPDDRDAFIEDYRRTTCTSLLKYIVEMDQGVHREGPRYKMKGSKKSNKWRRRPVVLSRMINTALNVCQEFLGRFEHKDIEMTIDTPEPLSEEEWTEFTDSYHRLLHGVAKVETKQHLVGSCRAMLQRLEEVNPQLNIEGIHNIWIIKPGAKSRGKGIMCANRLEVILRLVDGDPTSINERKWVVQKYLERPFLVYGTKFDVRQWFLVTDWNPLTVWFYKKCYLRFSTQPYSVNTLHSSVHLCNNSIQKHLTPSQQRHPRIPTDNMWSDDQFRDFLCSQGQEALWESVVVPGMKKAVIHALQTAQNLMEPRKNTFELYGADFLLGCDLHPWLLEINSSPTMAPSTPVTAHLCAAVQEDTLRVVLDRKVDRNANVGNFQLIFKQAAVNVPQYIGISLLVEGIAFKEPCRLPPLRAPQSSAPKPRGPIKEKDPAAEKMKMLTQKSAKDTETTLENTSSTVVSLPPLAPERFAPVPIKKLTLYLPMSVNKSIKPPVVHYSPTEPHDAEMSLVDQRKLRRARSREKKEFVFKFVCL